MLTKSPGYTSLIVNRQSIIRKQSQMETKQTLCDHKMHFKNISTLGFNEHSTIENAMKQQEYITQAQKEQSCF